MNIDELELYVRRNFNNAVCLIGIIPFLVFVYILSVKVSSLNALTGETGYIILASMLLLLLGIFIGKKIIRMVIKRLFEYNREVLKLQGELIEKNRLKAITQTTLTLSHEINNPLAIIVGSVESLKTDFKKENVPDSVKEKVDLIEKHGLRIKDVTRKLSEISKPVITSIGDNIEIVDTEKSV